MAKKDSQSSVMPVTSQLQHFSDYFRLKNLRIGHKLALIVAVFSLFIFFLLIVSSFGMGILSDVRVCVSGKEVWAIARRDAVMRLEHYVNDGNEADYQFFLKNQAIAIGDRKAFIEIKKDKTDFKKVEAGFIEGGNHPQDVGRIARLFERFYWIPYVQDAIRAWENADSLLDDMLKLGAAVQQEVLAGSMTDEKRKDFLARIEEISEKTRPWEIEFDYKLTLYGRVLTQILVSALIGLAIILLVAGVFIARAIARHLMGEIGDLQKAATKIAEGNFTEPIDVSSRDEIGDLARNFQQMAMQREQAEKMLDERARELAGANQKLLETERIKDEFFATVSHELRTPLTLVLTPLESLLMANPSALSDAERRILEIMHNNALRLLQMVTGLLDFSKFGAGRMEVKREATDITAVTRSIADDFQAMLLQKRIDIRLHAGPSVLVLMDRYFYERILFNLLSNAIKFTPEGGSVSVSLEWREGRLSLAVSDTGIGISEENQKHLFEKFKQIEGASTRRFEGTGLGLALVKEFATLLEGTVWVESEPGKGSTFTVECAAPEADAAESQVLARPRQKLVQQYRMDSGLPLAVDIPDKTGLPKLLIAEDNLEMASYLATQVQNIAQIKIARDGEEALELLRAWSPDLVLSDVMMPRRDGLSLCRAIKTDADTAHIPVVLLTALTHREALLQGWEAGADEYLFKPFHPTELITRVKSVLANSQERRRVQAILRDANRQLELNVQERTAELVGANKSLLQQKRDLEAVNLELDSFVYTASHDLRAPLRAIASFSGVLKGKYANQMDEEGQGYLARIEQAAIRMSRLINDLMLVSRLSRIENPYEDVSIQALLDSVLQRIDFDIQEAGVEINIQENMPVISCDRIKMEEVFLNLINNAVKFSRAKQASGKLTVDIGHKGLEEMHEFYVKDQGIGIDPRYQDRIFDMFWQLEPSQAFQSTGVGLSIVKRVIQWHGGSVRIESKAGEGATFYFTVPRNPQHNHGREIQRKEEIAP